MAAILPMGDLVKGVKYADKAHIVYQAIDKSDAVKYVGITSRDLAVREAEHKAKEIFKDLRFIEIVKTINRLEARVMEQKLINNFGLDNLYNRINSIAPSKWVQHGIK